MDVNTERKGNKNEREDRKYKREDDQEEKRPRKF